VLDFSVQSMDHSFTAVICARTSQGTRSEITMMILYTFTSYEDMEDLQDNELCIADFYVAL
jgi:hypothetical protein